MRIRRPRTANPAASAQLRPNVSSPTALADRGGVRVFQRDRRRSCRPAVDQEPQDSARQRLPNSTAPGSSALDAKGTASRRETDTVNQDVWISHRAIFTVDAFVPVLSPSVRHQSRQPSASRPAARRRSGVWRRSRRRLAGRLRHRDTLKDPPTSTWACTAVRPSAIALVSMRNRNIVRGSPGVSASITICLTMVRSPRQRGQERRRRSLRQVEPRSVSSEAFPAVAHSRRRGAVLPRSKAGCRSGDHRDGLA